MYFTKEDLRTIEQYLKLKSMRDSQFETLESSDLQSDDIMVVVHEDENRKITLADFINSATIATLLENRIQQYEDYRNQLDQELRLLRQIINNIEVGKVGIINNLGDSVTEGISQALLTYYINQFLGKNSTFEQQISTIDGQVTDIDGQITDINNQLVQLSEDIQNAMSIEMTDYNYNPSAQTVNTTYKRVVISKGGEEILNYYTPVVTFSQKVTPPPVVYPDVWYIGSDSPLTTSQLQAEMTNSNKVNNASPHTKTFSTYEYYVVVPNSYRISKVVSDENMPFTEGFQEATEYSINGYKVYHYTRDTNMSLTLIFTIANN